MKEPKIHSTINRVLPEGHWLADEKLIRCVDCSQIVYQEHMGTTRNWLENGKVMLEYGPVDSEGADGVEEWHWEPQIYCAACFFTHDRHIAEISEEWALTDDNKPQKGIMPQDLDATEKAYGLSRDDIPENPYDPDNL